MRSPSVGFIVILLGMLVVGCKAPAGLGTIDPQTEIEIGQQAAAQLEAQYGLVNDPAEVARVNTIGKRIAAQSDDPQLPWTFKILNSNEINAVTLPGGIIYVMQGMMQYVQNEGQLAGVVGHEITHAARHHTAKMIQKAMPEQLLVALLTQHSSAAVQQAATIALQVRETRWSRELEYESDEYGTQYAYQADYPVTGLRDLLLRLYNDQGDPARITWVLMDHPALSQRIERLNKDILPRVTGRPPS